MMKKYSVLRFLRPGVTALRNTQGLPNVEQGKVEVGAEILQRIAREFGRTMELLLTGEGRP